VGQALSVPELEYMHIHKTGALIRASVALGARCSARSPRDSFARLDHYAKCVGLCFSGGRRCSRPGVFDRDTRQDRRQGRGEQQATYVSALGLARAKALAEELREEAQAALTELRGGARRLAELADFIVLRKF